MDVNGTFYNSNFYHKDVLYIKHDALNCLANVKIQLLIFMRPLKELLEWETKAKVQVDQSVISA